MTEAVAERAVDVPTPDGVCDAVLFYPGDGKPHPGVVLYPDVKALRSAVLGMASRLASHGYAVLAVNQFYRVGRRPVWHPTFDMSHQEDRPPALQRMKNLDHPKVMRDAAAFVAFLDVQQEVDPSAKLGGVGFCMGGPMTVRLAATAPDRVGAAASFHGGFLVTDEPTSPHRLLAKTKARYHFGVAVNDDLAAPNDKIELKGALDAARLDGTVEVYPGANHGWMMPDVPPHNPAQAERGWAAMLELFGATLR
ncbi:MAG TPA: dienelactone hydrolase family protein [Stellaceae bacterium]|nr:dienelactone hydrolase family protein [Stellaceae bacterium]